MKKKSSFEEVETTDCVPPAYLSAGVSGLSVSTNKKSENQAIMSVTKIEVTETETVSLGKSKKKKNKKKQTKMPSTTTTFQGLLAQC